MNIGILSIATGKYVKFLRPLYESIQKFFLKDHKKTFIIFTDNVEFVTSLCQELNIKNQIFQIERKGFPGDTLYRYHHFHSAREKLKSLGIDCPDALYYFDADMLVTDNVGDEVLPTRYKTLIATAHPGFYNRPGNNPLGTPETRQMSKAFIPQDRYRPCYWAGGFNGGGFEAFMSLSAGIVGRINEDDKNNIIAVWHDESHLNCYLSEHFIINQVKTLTPSYCYPESWNLSFPKKIIALDKNHEEVRSV